MKKPPTPLLLLLLLVLVVLTVATGAAVPVLLGTSLAVAVWLQLYIATGIGG